MPTYAVLNGGVVVSERAIDDFDAYPAHKKAAKDERGDGHPVLRPVSGQVTTPTHDPLTHVASMSYDIRPDGVTRIWQVTPRELGAVKADAKARIDLDAEAARLRYITAGSGQAMEYQEAAAEAVRYVATSGAGAYPMLQASVDAGEAANLAAAAALITAREDAWATIGANIRRLRLTAKRAIDAATTVEQVQAAATVTWPCP